MSLEMMFDVATQHRVGLERLSTGVLKKLTRHLADCERDVEQQIRDRLDGMRPGVVTDFTTERLRRLLERLRRINAEAHAALSGDLQSQLLEIAKHEGEWTAEAYAKVFRLNALLDEPSAAMLKKVVTARPFQGAILKDWTEGLAKTSIDRIQRAVMMGLTEGEGADGIVKRLKGAKLEGATGEFELNRRSADMVVRTAVNHVTNQAHLETLRANPGLFPRYRWSSILDGRTSPICRERAGQVYEMGKGPVPPAHYRCRSTIVGIPRGVDPSTLPDTTYKTWFEKQKPEKQLEILGPSRYALFTKGKLPLDRFVSRDGDQITLDQLRKQNAEAFKAAGLDGGPLPTRAELLGAKPTTPAPRPAAKARRSTADDKPADLGNISFSNAATLDAQVRAGYRRISPEEQAKKVRDTAAALKAKRKRKAKPAT